MYNLAQFGRNPHVSHSTPGSSGSQSTTLQASPHWRPRLLVRRYGRGSGRIPAPAHPGTVGPQHRQPRLGGLSRPVRLLLRRHPGRVDGRPLRPQEGHALGSGLLLPHVSGGGNGPQLRNLPDCTDLCRTGCGRRKRHHRAVPVRVHSPEAPRLVHRNPGRILLLRLRGCRTDRPVRCSAGRGRLALGAGHHRSPHPSPALVASQPARIPALPHQPRPHRRGNRSGGPL